MKTTLEDYREHLKEEGIEKSPLCDDVLFWIETNGLPVAMSQIWQAFPDQKRGDIRSAVLWLVMEGFVFCDPSKTRYRKYEADPRYLKRKRKEIEAEKQKKKENSAQDTMLALDPTIINTDVRNMNNEEIARLSGIQCASDINTNENNDLMVSIQDKHVVVVLTPKQTPYAKIREFLGRLDTLTQLNEGLFFDLDTESDHGE